MATLKDVLELKHRVSYLEEQLEQLKEALQDAQHTQDAQRTQNTQHDQLIILKSSHGSSFESQTPVGEQNQRDTISKIVLNSNIYEISCFDFIIIQNGDLKGSDISNSPLQSTTVTQCCEACAKSPRCNTFSLSDINGEKGKCWLKEGSKWKSALPQLQSREEKKTASLQQSELKEGVVSGFYTKIRPVSVPSNTGDPCQEYFSVKDTTIIGFDISDSIRVDKFQCCMKCSMSARCAGYSFSSGECWLKEAIPLEKQLSSVPVQQLLADLSKDNTPEQHKSILEELLPTIGRVKKGIVSGVKINVPADLLYVRQPVSSIGGVVFERFHDEWALAQGHRCVRFQEEIKHVIHSLASKEAHVVMKELLQEWKNMMNAIDLPWWIEGGTLLGAYRENDIIEWDDDVDVAITRETLQQLREKLPNYTIDSGIVFNGFFSLSLSIPSLDLLCRKIVQ